MNVPKYTYPTYSADLVIQGPQGPPGLSGGNAVYNYLYSGGTAAIDPGAGGIAIQTTGGQSRRIAISKTDADGTPRRPEMLLTGDTVTVTDSPATPPVTGWARYVLTNDPVDNGAFVVFDALRTDTTGSQTPPTIGTPLRVYGSMSGGGPVTTGMIVDGAVTTPKIADAAITDNKIGGSLAPIISVPETGRLVIGGVEIGNTGARGIDTLFKNGWTTQGGTARWNTIQRTGTLVHANLWVNGYNSTAAEIMSLPPGFRGLGGNLSVGSWRQYSAGANGQWRLTQTEMDVYRDGTTTNPTVPDIVIVATWITDDAWPETLPGEQVTPPSGMANILPVEGR